MNPAQQRILYIFFAIIFAMFIAFMADWRDSDKLKPWTIVRQANESYRGTNYGYVTEYGGSIVAGFHSKEEAKAAVAELKRIRREERKAPKLPDKKLWEVVE